MSSTTKRKSFCPAFCGKLPPPLFSILIYPSGQVSKKDFIQLKTNLKVFGPAFFQKSWQFPKAEPLVARMSETGVWGRSPRPIIVQKSFLSNFFQKKFVRTKFAEQEQ